ncbi:hypothetical protein ITP53_28840 [Nonomuraea sp. K274]|uniref:Uncharacterized protein n=1 Tax=Nonomuraea cypriaca TaxID=1187855 RepID=A0A931F3E1_9ACTN|nr:hypothetical protein [Nonomuraea cypriaca]MBF8189668.1 hypothetical protein [Nonomuraea cypriaca]
MPIPRAVAVVVDGQPGPVVGGERRAPPRLGTAFALSEPLPGQGGLPFQNQRFGGLGHGIVREVRR